MLTPRVKIPPFHWQTLHAAYWKQRPVKVDISCVHQVNNMILYEMFPTFPRFVSVWLQRVREDYVIAMVESSWW